MEPRKNVARFNERAQHPDHRSDELRASVAADRMARFLGSTRRKQARLTLSQSEALESQRLLAFEKRRGRG